MPGRARRYVVLGGSGLVGSRVRELAPATVEVVAPTHAELDVLDTDALTAFLGAARPDAVLNLVAWADVDAAEAQRGDRGGRVYRLNAQLPGALAMVCAGQGVQLVHVSTDYVFDGTARDRPYREQDPTNPLCWYAETKLRGEQAVCEAGGSACIARIEMPFAATRHPKGDFARTCWLRLRAGQPVLGVVDQRITPVFLDDAARALLQLAGLGAAGIVHVAAASWTTPYEMARAIALRLRLDAGLVQAVRFDEFGARRPARRPQNSWLDVSLCRQLLGPDILRTIDAQLDGWAEQLLAVAGPA